MRKVFLLHWSLFWMNESENLAQWIRLVTITQPEWVDHAAMAGCLGGRLWAVCANFLNNVVVLEAVV